MASHPPLLTAVSSSARHILLLLRCISFAKKATVRLSPEGLRFSTEEGSVMEALVFLEKALFTSYSYNPPAAPSSQHHPPHPPVFEVSLTSLLETLNIFSISDPSTWKRAGEYDSVVTHRLHRHAGINAFSNPALGVTGICTITYHGPGSPLGIHMSEAGVTTTCDLTTYEARTDQEIPFNRDRLSLKTILRCSCMLDAMAELASMSPAELTIHASPAPRAANLSLTAVGALGSATVDFTAPRAHPDPAPVLETFHCPAPTTARFAFALVKAAQPAMASASKLSLRLDDQGVLSMQYLVEMESGPGEAVAFVDYRVVPLVEGEAEEEEGDEGGGGGGGGGHCESDCSEL